MAATFAEIVEAARNKGKKRLAVPAAKKADLGILSRAAEEGLVVPVLVGNGNDTETLVKKSALKAFEYEIVDAKDGGLQTAVRLVREGRAAMLMQGACDTKAFMNAILDGKSGLLAGKLASYVSVFEMRKAGKLILVTDTFVNNFPTIAEKLLILEQSLKLAGILGIAEPKVAALAAIEQVNPSIPSTLDAAIIAKMSERKQFGSAVVDGPLDIDCALSHAAAERKGLKSAVTGNIDIYLVPEIESGYLLAQSLVFFGKMEMAGVLMGTAKPVILSLPFVSWENRLVEIAVACML
ncbi:MAG TPA: phosphate acyltransferase [Syntrophales bacterium]|nr:phosphate acyltransferase [Syntrophales bacterium]